MKEILELLQQLDDATGDLYSIRIFSDFSGALIDDDEVFSFDNKKQLKKKLRKLIKKHTL